MSTIKLSKNPMLHGRSKHIDVRFHFLCALCKEDTIELNFCRSDEQIADLFTKPLKQPLFEKLRRKMRTCRIQDVVQEDKVKS